MKYQEGEIAKSFGDQVQVIGTETFELEIEGLDLRFPDLFRT